MNIQPSHESQRPSDQAGDLTRPFSVVAPTQQTVPLVFASPHSGQSYPAAFIAASGLDLLTLRRSEDSFVNELFALAPHCGAPLIHALFPRAYLDANREPYELDPGMFEDALPAYANTRSLRVAGGLGTVARVVTDGAEIYTQKISFAEAEDRIEKLYLPYHRALKQLLDQTVEHFGHSILIDCHSMPSVGGPMDEDRGHGRADIVLGDRFGTSCAPALTQCAEMAFTSLGYTVARNNPYAGGYTTDHYGRPIRNIHALQIEINRGIYMDESTLTRSANFNQVVEDMGRVIEALAQIEAVSLRMRR